MKTSNKFLLVTLLLFLLSSTNFLFAQDDALDHFVKAETLKKQGKVRESLSEYDKAIAKDGTNAKFFYNKGLVYLRLKESDKAIECFENSIKVEKDYVDGYSVLGKIYENQRKVDQAVLAYNEVFNYTDDKKKKLEYKLQIIRLYYKANRFEESANHIEDSKKIDPENVNVLYLDGLYNNTVEKYAEAKVSLTKAIGLVADRSVKETAKYYFELGRALFHLEEYPEAEVMLKRVQSPAYASRIQKMTPEYYCKLAYAYFKAYQKEKSTTLVGKAIKMRPEYPEAHDLTVKLASSHVDKSTVIDLKKGSINSETREAQKAEKLAELAQLELDAGRYEDAIVSAKACLTVQTKNYAVIFIKAVAQYQLENYDNAITTLEEGLALKALDLENKAKYNFTLGLLYKKMGKKQEAFDSFKRAEYGSFRSAAQSEYNEINL
jgi:tetratricopeptide (TPR) repeat protein